MKVYTRHKRASSKGPVPVPGFGRSPPSSQSGPARNAGRSPIATPISAANNPAAELPPDQYAVLERLAMRAKDPAAARLPDDHVSLHTRCCGDMSRITSHLKSKYAASSSAKCRVCGCLTRMRCGECDVALCFFPAERRVSRTAGSGKGASAAARKKRPKRSGDTLGSAGDCFCVYHDSNRLGSIAHDKDYYGKHWKPPASKNAIEAHTAQMKVLFAKKLPRAVPVDDDDGEDGDNEGGDFRPHKKKKKKDNKLKRKRVEDAN